VDANAKAVRIAQQRERFRRAIDWLLGDEHPKQQAFTSSKAQLVAGFCTRRAGKTRGGVRRVLADAIRNVWWQVYVNETRAEAVKLVWSGPPKQRDGLMPLLHDCGLKEGLDYRTNKTELRVTIVHLGVDRDEESYIDLVGADDEDQCNKLRGPSYNRAWLDEAQKLRHIEPLIRGALMPAMMDFGGQIWLTGTPSVECAGLFYDVTNLEQPEQGWEVHRWSVRDNPFFGATPDERWARTGAVYLQQNNITADDPDFRREWGPEWVKEGARYVYAIHSVEAHRRTFAPQRLLADGFYDHERAIADLPRRPNGRAYQWMFGIGGDLGYDPDPFALAIGAFTPELRDIYEMWSWKQTKLIPDEQMAVIRRLMRVVPFVVMPFDPAGANVKGMLKGWQERYDVPVEEADKAHKATWREMLNGDIRAGRVHFREGSPLLDEMVHLQWRRQTSGNAKPVEWADRVVSSKSKRVPGNHCCDGWLYQYRHMTHYLYQDKPPPPKVGTPEWAQREAEQMEQAVDEYVHAKAHEEDFYGYE